jgi:hypothetical protein
MGPTNIPHGPPHTARYIFNLEPPEGPEPANATRRGHCPGMRGSYERRQGRSWQHPQQTLPFCPALECRASLLENEACMGVCARRICRSLFGPAARFPRNTEASIQAFARGHIPVPSALENRQVPLRVWDLFPTVDHKVPVSRGGNPDDLDNWITTSMLRNSAKANFTLEELGWALHPPGSLDEWDGLTGWFLQWSRSATHCWDDVDGAYLREWQRAALSGFSVFGHSPPSTKWQASKSSVARA